MDTKTAIEITGGLSRPSKMPGYGYSIPATRCRVGSKLREKPDSVCEGCYALKGRYSFGHVKKAMERRFQSLVHPQWVEAMTFLIKKSTKKSNYFRWHDSGDLQDLNHLQRIVDVCNATPRVKHWLPTREYGTIFHYVKIWGKKFPANLNVRLSAHFIDAPAPAKLASQLGVSTSTVSSLDFSCPSSLQGNQCGNCRMCWNRNVANVSYHLH